MREEEILSNFIKKAEFFGLKDNYYLFKYTNKKGTFIKVEAEIYNNYILASSKEECITLRFNYFESENCPIKKITLEKGNKFFSEIYALILKSRENMLDDLL